MKVLIGFLVAFLASVSQGQIISSGPCTNATLVPNFSMQKYSGDWFEVYRYEYKGQRNGECVSSQYFYKNTSIDMWHSMVIEGRRSTIGGDAYFAPDAKGTGKLALVYPNTPNINYDYWVLSTDYTSYSLVYTCKDLPKNTKTVSSWILSRSQTLKPQAILAMHEAMDSVDGLFWDNYRQTDHSAAACKRN